MKTTQVGPALGALDDLIHQEALRFIHASRERLQKAAERVSVRAELERGGEHEPVPAELIALRLSDEVYRAFRAYMTWQVGEAQWMGFSNPQIAAALRLASPSNVRTKYETSAVRAALNASGVSDGVAPVQVGDFVFRFPLLERFDRNETADEDR
ncbi:MAG: hypothetical protein K0R99_4062 [Microbacterium sp.]|jgi:hypothetical protein|uniref:hypothetical protein n=1 Tax=Microbacterium sp. TaxID=51671 RepID=UPI00262C726F|nr:hypothetical protein [Microbacterium sp.]MDF2562616.1 hypothetical protein [Microbacterium sp.]